MGTKGVSFGYFEFSRAIWGKPCSHARAAADCPPALAGPRTWAWACVQPGPVLFEPGHTGLVLKRTGPYGFGATAGLTRPAPLPYNGSDRNQALLSVESILFSPSKLISDF